jgi:hypothetical protein
VETPGSHFNFRFNPNIQQTKTTNLERLLFLLAGVTYYTSNEKPPFAVEAEYPSRKIPYAPRTSLLKLLRLYNALFTRPVIFIVDFRQNFYT